MEFRYDFDSAEELKTFRVLNTTKTWDNGEVRLQFDGDGDGLFYLQFVPSVDGTNRTLKVRLRAAATVGVKPWIKSPLWHDWGDKEITTESAELALDLDALGVDVTRVSQVGIDIWKPDSVWVDAIWSEPTQ
jgi:hypothetical protein